MLSWVYMKILESRPERYDRGIALLSLGRAARIRARVVELAVREGDRVLDVGTGTAEVAIGAARAGAVVTAMDVSAGMLDRARQKVRALGLDGRVTLVEAGVTEMDGRFADGSFDVVTASLVMSELYDDEQRWALRQFARVLARGGRLVVSDEVRPSGVARRVMYEAARLPLAALTYALTQTGTRALDGIEAKVREAGLTVGALEWPHASHLILLAVKDTP